MLTPKEQLEYELLQILRGNERPMGSLSLSLLLMDRSLGVSAATIGRMLSEFDFAGYTKKEGYRGRVLAQSGENRLIDLQRRLDLENYSSLFASTVDAKNKDNLLDILTARRGIEREIARLAAANATQKDISNIQEIYRKQAEKAAHGMISSESDVIFHRAIGAASKNKVLASAYDFIWQNGRFSPIMEYVRTAVGGTISVEHGKILDAIVAKDCDEAERCMLAHIDNLISDVQAYWKLAQQKDRRKRKRQTEDY